MFLTYSPNLKCKTCIDNSQENLILILGLRELIASLKIVTKPNLICESGNDFKLTPNLDLTIHESRLQLTRGT